MKIITVLLMVMFVVGLVGTCFAGRLVAGDTTTIWAPGIQYTKKNDTGKMGLLPDIYKFVTPIDLEDINRNGFDNGPVDTFYFETLWAW